MQDLMQQISNAPLHWKIWMNLLGVLNFGAIIFAFKDVRARWVVAAMICNMVFMSFLYNHFGYTRILGLSHVVFWTPLVIYLYKARNAYPQALYATRWLWAVMVVNSLSLIIDYTDVIRYSLGDHAIL